MTDTLTALTSLQRLTGVTTTELIGPVAPAASSTHATSP